MIDQSTLGGLSMPNDAKLGMLAGVAAVLVAAVVYYQKPASAEVPTKPVAGTRALPPGVPPAAVKVPARTVSTSRVPLDD